MFGKGKGGGSRKGREGNGKTESQKGGIENGKKRNGKIGRDGSKKGNRKRRKVVRKVKG